MRGPIQTVVIAPREEAEIVQKMLNNLEDKEYQILRIFQEINSDDTLQFITDSETSLVIALQTARGFRTGALQEFVQAPGQTARVIVTFVERGGAIFDAALDTGAIVYHLPLEQEDFNEIDELYEARLAKATQRMAANMSRPEDAPDVHAPRQTFAGLRKQKLQVFTVWSSKGGDGKTQMSRELAYMLANVSGRKTLLVDADMNRGYIAPSLGQERIDAAEGGRNITKLANKFRTAAKMPLLENYVYNYPPAFGKGGRGNLDILFGITSPDQAILPAFRQEENEEGESEGPNWGEEFIKELCNVAQTDYEFLIFDIGSLIYLDVHAACLRQCSELLVVSSPMLPAIRPTTDGLLEMGRLGLISKNPRDKASLILNRYDKSVGYREDEFPQFINLEILATIPLMDEALLMKITNKGMFTMEAYITGAENDDGLKAMANQLIGLCEFYSQGTMGQVAQLLPDLGKKRKSKKSLSGLNIFSRGKSDENN